MYVIDPDTDLPIEEQPSAADAAAVVEAATPAEPTAEEAIAAAMDKGVEEATPEVAPAADEAKPEAVPGAEPTQAEKDAAAAEAAKVEPDKEVEAEITGLGLKEKAAARFRELTAEVKELAPIRAQLEAAGIKDVAEIPVLAKRAKDGADLVQMVTDTGATAEQFGMQLDYMSLLQKVNTGDIAAAEKAYAMAMGEAEALAKILGKEVPGVHDPLAAHADLLADIEAGDLTRKRALEIAAQRQRETVATAARTNAEATRTLTEAQQRAQTEAIETGKAALQAFDERAAVTDPHYAAKRPILNDAVVEIRKKHPPHLWASETALAYAAIPNPAPAPAPKPPIGPVRPTGPRPAMAQAAFDDPFAAMDAAIAETS